MNDAVGKSSIPSVPKADPNKCPRNGGSSGSADPQHVEQKPEQKARVAKARVRATPHGGSSGSRDPAVAALEPQQPSKKRREAKQKGPKALKGRMSEIQFPESPA